jgi:hypothetical protein
MCAKEEFLVNFHTTSNEKNGDLPTVENFGHAKECPFTSPAHSYDFIFCIPKVPGYGYARARAE